VAIAAILHRLRQEAIAIDAVVGCSVGGLVGALYAAAGIGPEELIQDARRLGPGALFAVAVSRWGLARRGGRVPAEAPARLIDRLGSTSFDTLHFGVGRLAFLALDLFSGRILVIDGGPGRGAPLTVARAVAATIAIPGIFPPVPARIGGRARLLIDPGWFTSVPVEQALSPPIAAQRVVAVDLSLLSCPRQARRRYWDALQEKHASRLLVLRPRVRGCGTMIGRPGDDDRLVEAGFEAVDSGVVRTLHAWDAVPRDPAPRPVPSPRPIP
jgi:predicted acylesterase/phospholipase RssA